MELSQQTIDEIQLVGVEPKVLAIDTLPPVQGGRHIRRPPQQVIRGPHVTLLALLKRGKDQLDVSFWEMFVLSLTFGIYVTLGALLSVFIATGIDSNGLTRLVLGIGLAAGFIPAFLSGGLLFHDPAAIASAMLVSPGGGARSYQKLVLLWLIGVCGNYGGSLLTAIVVRGGWVLFAPQRETLGFYANEIVDYGNPGGADAWFACLCNAIIGGLLVSYASIGMTSAQTASGKIWLIIVPVVTFLAASIEVTVANMGYTSLALVDNDVPEINWGDTIWYNLIPSIIGNAIGTIILVILFYYYAYVMNPHSSGSPAGPSARHSAE